MTFNQLYELIKKRQKELPKNSYTAELFRKGKDRIIQKVGEEAVEVVIAAKNGKKKEIISEISDLWFNLLILLVQNNISLEEIETELEKRRQTKVK